MSNPGIQSFLSLRWQLIILFISSLLLYSNTFNHGFVLDDEVVFLGNKYVQEGVDGIDEIISHGFLHGFNSRNDQSYRPLVLINYAIEKEIFGNQASALHIMHVIYYGLLSLIVFLFLRRIFQKKENYLVFWICLLYIFHPVHTEVVANIKGRDEILHAIFAFSSLYFILKHQDVGKKRHLTLALICFFLALLSKEMAVSLILLVPTCLYFFREIELKKLSRITFFYVFVLMIYLWIRNMVLDNITFDEEMTVMNNTLAAADSLGERIATNFLIFGKYISLLVWPHPLSWDYSYPYFPIVNFAYAPVALILIAFLSLIAFAIYGIRNKNIYAWGIWFFLFSFAVVSNFFILIGSTLGERFLFFPSIAFCVILVVGLKDIFKKINLSIKPVKPIMAVLLLIIIAYGFKSRDRNEDWKSNKSLFEAGVEATPQNSRAVAALATIYREKGERATNEESRRKNLEKAKSIYRESIALYMKNTDALYNLGVTYNNLGQKEKAKWAYEQVLSYSPRHVNALNNLGVIYFQRSDFRKAEEFFREAVRIQPDLQNAWANLGAVYHNQGNREKALEYYRKALELNPRDINTRKNYENLMK